MAKGKLGYKIRTITCIGCGKSHTDHVRPKQTYCSLDCYRNSPRPVRKTGATLTCEECGEPFYVARSRINTARFCSMACHDDEQRRTRPTDTAIVANMRRAQQLQVRSRAPTRPERALYALLDELDVPYERQHVIDNLMTVDACLLEQRLVIQADGDYWHGRHRIEHPRVANRVRLDKSQDAYLGNRDWAVLRLWGSDLLSHPARCRSVLAQAIRQPQSAAA